VIVTLAVAVLLTVVPMKERSTCGLPADWPLALNLNVTFCDAPAAKLVGHAEVLVAQVTLAEQVIFST